MGFISGTNKVSGLVVDANLNMGAHDITLGAGQLVDGKDVSGLTGQVIAKGTYAGNSTANRSIAHSLGAVPKQVLIFDSTGRRAQISGDDLTHIHYLDQSFAGNILVGTMTTSNFVVGSTTSYDNSMNETGTTYYWIAFV